MVILTRRQRAALFGLITAVVIITTVFHNVFMSTSSYTPGPILFDTIRTESSFVISSCTSTPKYSRHFSTLVGKDYSNLPEELRHYRTDAETVQFLDLLQVLDCVTRDNNITMFINYGTLLGSVRHHALTPWDDDCDVGIPIKDREKTLKLLKELKYQTKQESKSANNITYEFRKEWDYSWIPSAYTQIRFIGKYSKQHNPPWRLIWPFIDIDFYSEDKETITFYHDTSLIYQRSIVFPLVLRPLGGIWLNAPRDFMSYVIQTYKEPEKCHPGWRHKMGYGFNNSGGWRYCDTFKDTYPYVKRDVTNLNHVRETLMLGDKILYSVDIGDLPPQTSPSIIYHV